MSVAEIKQAVEKLSPEELADLSAFLARRDGLAWDRQIDADFAERGHLSAMLAEVRADVRSGRLEELPS